MKERLGVGGWRGDRGSDVDVIDQRDRGRRAREQECGDGSGLTRGWH